MSRRDNQKLIEGLEDEVSQIEAETNVKCARTADAMLWLVGVWRGSVADPEEVLVRVCEDNCCVNFGACPNKDLVERDAEDIRHRVGDLYAEMYLQRHTYKTMITLMN
jgi:hypothetical protein